MKNKLIKYLAYFLLTIGMLSQTSCAYDVVFKRYNQVIHTKNNRKMRCQDIYVYLLDKPYYLLFKDYNYDHYVEHLIYYDVYTDEKIREVFRTQELTEEDKRNFEIMDYITNDEMNWKYVPHNDYEFNPETDTIPYKY